MAHDASGGVDCDGLLLDWLLPHKFNCWGAGICRVGPGRIQIGSEQGVEKGASLGGGEGGWCVVGVGRGYSHVGEMDGER